VVAKLESLNPGGSVKDRIAKSMIDDAECSGALRPGDVITAVGRVEDIRERTGSIGQMLITTIKVTYRNQTGAIVATQTSTSIRH